MYVALRKTIGGELNLQVSPSHKTFGKWRFTDYRKEANFRKIDDGRKVVVTMNSKRDMLGRSSARATVLRQTALYLPAQILAPVIQFASILIWTHLMSPRDMGVVTLAFAVQEVSFVLFFGWWQRYTLRFLRGFEGSQYRIDFLRSETAAVLLSSLLQILALVPVIIWLVGEARTLLFVLITLFIVTRSLSNYVADRARANADITLYSLIQICGPVFGFIIGVPMLFRFGSSPNAVFVGFAIAQIIGLFAAVLMSDFLKCRPRINHDIFRTAITFGGTVMIATLLATLALNVPRFIVSGTLGLKAMGVFAVGYSLGLRASSFAVTLVTAGAYPLVVKRMEMEGKEAAFMQLQQNMVLVALAVMPVAFGLIGVNRLAVDVLVDEQYRAVTYAVLPLATVGGLFRYLRAHTSDQVFLVCLKPAYATWVALVDIVVAILSTWVGVKTMGLPGAAVGPLISGLFTFTASFVFSYAHFGFRPPFGEFGRILLVSAVMCAVVRLLPVPKNATGLAAAVIAGGFLYCFGIALTLPKAREVCVRMLRRS
ncbi:lipopolysaccharide biosynthesis protein [Sphingobium yanoikuyae]|uniref:Lipopolysaccharide biosynthesis protein n=1 Tax=Sphingobium yanoikuyae TaxID=13690 RepID=A0A9X7UE52_SPHYA|nr:lipopolysaccharide biosynthesis protein [Sphingobium yanoikuyae]QNG48482.1 lipopolysaccharide biosynthesis protein [Sphingobium yanoikuyae]